MLQNIIDNIENNSCNIKTATVSKIFHFMTFLIIFMKKPLFYETLIILNGF